MLGNKWIQIDFAVVKKQKKIKKTNLVTICYK